jgi:hypothetical protein
MLLEFLLIIIIITVAIDLGIVLRTLKQNFRDIKTDLEEIKKKLDKIG